MKSSVITIKNKKQFCDFFDRLDDYEFINSNKFRFEFPNIRIHLDGTQFNSSLTGEIIKGLNKYQESIYKSCRAAKFGNGTRKKLTDEELKKYEIKVTVSEGSTDILLSFVNTIMEMKNMTGTEMLIGIGIVSGVWLIKSIAQTGIKEVFKTSRQKIEAKLTEAKVENEQYFYSNLIQTINNTTLGVKDVLTSVADANSKKIVIDNQIITPNEIQSYIEEMLPNQKKDKTERTYTVKDAFKVLNLNYESVTTLMKALHVETNQIYDNISLQDEWIKYENYKMIQEAEKRESISLTIIVQEIGKKRKCMLDVESVGK